MRLVKVLGGAGAVLLAVLGLAACGGSSPKPTPSALDPANRVPANVIAYASVTVRPQGSVRDDLRQAVDELAGKGTFAKLDAKLTRGLSKSHEHPRSLDSWLGQRIGIALTALPSNGVTGIDDDLVLIAPTSNPSAARSYLSQVSKQKKSHVQDWKVQGNYAIFGGAVGVADALATKSSDSLASSAGYKADVGQSDSGQLASFVLRLHPLVQALSALLRRRGTTPVAFTPFTPPSGMLPNVPVNEMAFASFGVGSKSFRLDLLSNGVPAKSRAAAGKAGSVAGLPDGSWVALALGGFLGNPSDVAKLNQVLPPLLGQIHAREGTGGGKATPVLAFLQRDLLPALGPMALSISGTSLPTLKGGFQIAPLDTAAGGKLARALKHLVAGLPVKVGQSDGKVLLTYGYAKARDLLTPASTLASDPGFKAAMAQLPSGSTAPIYINFGPIALLGQALDGKSSDAKVWQVAGKLNYLILGSTGTHARLVLALK